MRENFSSASTSIATGPHLADSVPIRKGITWSNLGLRLLVWLSNLSGLVLGRVDAKLSEKMFMSVSSILGDPRNDPTTCQR